MPGLSRFSVVPEGYCSPLSGMARAHFAVMQQRHRDPEWEAANRDWGARTVGGQGNRRYGAVVGVGDIGGAAVRGDRDTVRVVTAGIAGPGVLVATVMGVTVLLPASVT